MGDLEQLKRRLPLLQYLQQRQWTARPSADRQEWVGLCPLHRETRPSFYVNSRKNLFYCHGCGRGGDLIRFVEMSEHLSFRQSLAFLCQQFQPAADGGVLEQTAAWHRRQLHGHPEAIEYLVRRGLKDRALIEELGVGYAAGGNLRQHLMVHGYGFHTLRQEGLIDARGRDTFWQRVTFACRQQSRIVNFYGRSVGAAFPHRLLPRPKGDLFAWESVRQSATVILVEGLLDLAVLWQAGFRNTTCAIGTHLTPEQWKQLADQPGREVYIAFDQDQNRAGQQAAQRLAAHLHRAGRRAYVLALPDGHDPNSYFVAGASAADFTACLERARRS
jgi:DNA primase